MQGVSVRRVSGRHPGWRMRVGLAADSGGDVAALCRAFRLLKDQLGCERLFFLGGKWSDVDGFQETTLEAAIPPVERVTPAPTDLESLLRSALTPAPTVPDWKEPEKVDPVVRVAEKDSGAPPEDQKLIEMLGATLCIMVHNKADLTKEDLTNANLILHGKSKQPGLVRIGARAFITPGSVAGETATVAVLDHQPASLDVEFYDLQGRLLSKENIAMGSATKFSAR